MAADKEQTTAQPRLFGTDGVRGVANIFPMTAEMAMQLGRALAYIIRNGPHRHRVIIGKDTRLSGYMIEHALAAGIMSMGVDVALVGPLPTPAIANLTTSMRADAGAVISASHNPYEDNGIKFFWRDGFKLPDETENKIESLIFEKALESLRQFGVLVQADFQRVELNPTLEVSGTNPFRIIAQWHDKKNNAVLVFKSASLWFDPTQFLHSASIPVYLDPDRPSRY